MLTTVYFDNEGTRVKAIVPEDALSFFFSLGAYKTAGKTIKAPEVKKAEEQTSDTEKVDKPVSKGDKGNGRLGSFQWDKTAVESFNKKKDVQEYVENRTGKKFSFKRYERLKEVKEQALVAFEEYHNGQSN